MDFRIDIDQSSDATLFALHDLGDILANIPGDRTAFQQIGNAIRAGIANNFDRERAGDLYPWADLAKSTQVERQLLGFPAQHPILHRTGEYRSSFTDANHPLHYAAFSIRASGFEIEIGSADPRAPILEYGDDELIPARAAAVLSRDAVDRLSDVLHELIIAALEKGL